MLRRWLLALVVLCLAPLPLASVAGSSVGQRRYIVVLKDSAPAGDVAVRATGLGAAITSVFDLLNTVVVSLTPRDVARLRQDPRVASVTPDRPVRLLADSSEEDPAVPTGVARIGAGPILDEDGKRVRRPPRETAVALLDTGVAKRRDLNVVGGYDCAPAGGLLDGLLGARGNDDEDAIPADTNGHGTHVAGIVGARTSSPVPGVSPGTPLYAVRVFGADGSGSVSSVICGLNWVAEHAQKFNIKVVNMSLGGEGSDDGQCGAGGDDALHAAVCRLTDAGVSVVVAAGNDGGDLAKSMPAAYDEVLAVTAMADFDGLPGGLSPTPPCPYKGQDDTAATFSAYAAPGSADAEHTIAAPGVCITSTWNDGRLKTISGTSMASPHVAGLIARCIDAGPCAGMAPAQIIAKLKADAAARPTGSGFLGDTDRPIDGKFYGDLVNDVGY